MKTAEIKTEGSNQFVSLPEDCHIEGTEVFVKRVGRSLLLIPHDIDPWQLFFDSLDEFGPLDTMIAAQSLRLNVPLATNNTSEFSRVPGFAGVFSLQSSVFSLQSSVISRQPSETAAAENCQLPTANSGVTGPANCKLSTDDSAPPANSASGGTAILFSCDSLTTAN